MQENDRDRSGTTSEAVPTPDPRELAPAASTDIHDADRDESMIDEIIRESFPASDPPPWTSSCSGEPNC